MKSKNIISLGVMLVAATAFFFYGRGTASDEEIASTYAGPPEIIAATFTSAWCSACKILEPRLTKVRPDFSDKPVKFVDLDFTFGKNEDHQSLADENNFSEAYNRFKTGTGFTLLIDAETGKVIDSLTMNHSKEAMRAAIAQAIAFAAQPAPDASEATIIE